MTTQPTFAAPSVKISKTAAGALAVDSPYHPAFVRRAHKLNGKFRDRIWYFDGRDEEAVRAACIEVYGTDGTPCETRCVRVALDHFDFGRAESIFMAGRQVARVQGRDSGAKLGDGVVIIEGKIGSGGSRKNFCVMIEPGTVIEIRDVPIAKVRAIANEEGVTVIEPEPAPSAPDMTGAAAVGERVALVETDGPALLDEQIARLRTLDTPSRIAWLASMSRPELVALCSHTSLAIEHYRVRRDRLEAAILRAVETPEQPATQAPTAKIEQPAPVAEPAPIVPPAVDPELPILGTLPIDGPRPVDAAAAPAKACEPRPLAILDFDGPFVCRVPTAEAVDAPALDDVPGIVSEPAPAAQDAPQAAIEGSPVHAPEQVDEQPAPDQADAPAAPSAPDPVLVTVASAEPGIAEILVPPAPRSLSHAERYPQGCPLQCSDCTARLGAAAAEVAPVVAPVVVVREPMRDPRLPSPGTPIHHVSRGATRATAIVRPDGIEYAGIVYRTVNAAAKVAAASLGLTGERNGYEFWGLTRKPAKVASPALDRALDRLGTTFAAYAAAIEQATAIADPTDRDKARATVRAQLQAALATLEGSRLEAVAA